MHGRKNKTLPPRITTEDTKHPKMGKWDGAGGVSRILLVGEKGAVTVEILIHLKGHGHHEGLAWFMVKLHILTNELVNPCKCTH